MNLHYNVFLPLSSTANFPPMIQGPDTFQITINEEATYVVNISDPGDTFNVMIMTDTGTLPEGYTFTMGEADGEYIFTVTLTEVVMFTFTVAANDSIGASSSIQPQVCLHLIYIQCILYIIIIIINRLCISLQ